MNSDEILRRFRSHDPSGSAVIRIGEMRDAAISLAELIVDITPACREQSIALTKLEEVLFWANAAIARPPEEP